MRSSLRLIVTGLIALGAIHPAASQPAQGTPVETGAPRPLPVELLGLPQDAAMAVPTVTTYNYLIVGAQIAIIEPESRKVIQLLKC